MNTGGKLIAFAALVILCGSLGASAEGAIYSRNIGPGDFLTGISDNVGFYPEAGGLALKASLNAAPYIWVPSPVDGVVSKIDARSGHELAKYQIGPRGANWQPVAVTSGPDGYAYVTCRCPGSTGKIVRIATWDIADANGDGRIVSSVDRNGDHRVSATEVVGWGKDEAVSLFASAGERGACPSSIAFDDNGYMWVCLENECNLAKLDPRSGEELGKIMVDGHPSSILPGEKGYLWVLSRTDGTLSQVNSITTRLDNVINFGRCNPNSMCYDGRGVLWIASDQGLIDVNTDTDEWTAHPTRDGAALKGLTYDRDGGLWSAWLGEDKVIKFSADEGTELARVDVGRDPGSLSVDYDGYIWVLNESTANAMRVDAQACKVITEALTPSVPVCNGQFSGFDMVQGVSPAGSWRTMFDSGIPDAAWGMINWVRKGSGALTIKVRAANDPELLPLQQFTTVISGARFIIPNGQFIEVLATFKGDFYRSPVIEGIHIETTNRPPDISAVKPSKSVLFDRDGKYEWVGITGIKDPDGDKIAVEITSVTQDEPVLGEKKDGKTADATGVGTNGVWLRRICDQGTEDQPGNGRVYTVSYRATDEYSASTSGKVRVIVPPADYPAVAKDDGQKYDSTKPVQTEMIAKG